MVFNAGNSMKMANSSRKPLLRLLILLPLLLVACKEKKSGNQQNKDIPWYKTATIYSLEVGTFKDSNGDGIGDFKGLTEKLGYIDSLGANTIWLAPIMPSPGKDDGYDVTDFYSVNPKFGTMKDFREFLREAKKRKIRVLMDLVLNHTSDEHPWFRAARKDSTSKYRLWYVWADKKPKDANLGMVFPGVQKETWSYDSVAHKYYFHRFYKFQPDLNYGNPDVQQESFKILKFWLKQGVDGYRLDAMPFIIDLPETGSENPDRMIQLVAEMRRQVQSVKSDALLLGEANLSPKENKDYFGEENDGLQMMFNFYANQYLFYALASADVKPLVTALEDTKKKPQAAQWGYFLRNHDEIDLARLSEDQRNLVYAKFGPDTTMQLYDRGIRRRLAPMLNNPQLLRMAYSLLFSLPGTPVVRYGEELGMGDDLRLKERLSVRTPMQWSSAKNAGFSTSHKPFRPVISHGNFDYKKINVQSELADNNSLLNFIKQLIQLRKECPEIGIGSFTLPKTNSEHVLALLVSYGEKSTLVLHNFSPKTETVEVRLPDNQHGTIIPLLPVKSTQKVNTEGKIVLKMGAYAYQWYRFAKQE